MKAVVKKVAELKEKGQPSSSAQSRLSTTNSFQNILKAAGIKHEVLNAKNHEREGEIIAQAGKRAR
jgi:preprotein translocase subunit SecA